MKVQKRTRQNFDDGMHLASGSGAGPISGFDVDFATKARLQHLGERSSTYAHELRQPLFTIAMANENLRLLLSRKEVDRERTLHAVERIAEQVRRAQTIIDGTLRFASGTARELECADVAEAANNAVEFLGALFENAQIAVERRWPLADTPVGVSRIELEQVFANLLHNAADSIRERRRKGWLGQGRIAISVKMHRGQVRCLVSDNGVGLSPAIAAETIFQPFVTTKAENGTGLGLHICRQIVSKGNGIIELTPRSAGGACVEIRLPLTDEAAAMCQSSRPNRRTKCTG